MTQGPHSKTEMFPGGYWEAIIEAEKKEVEERRRVEEIRKIIREELERIERKRAGGKWLDGCPTCGAPTHGNADTCPDQEIGSRCIDGFRHDIETTTEVSGLRGIVSVKRMCRKCGSFTLKTYRPDHG